MNPHPPTLTIADRPAKMQPSRAPRFGALGLASLAVVAAGCRETPRASHAREVMGTLANVTAYAADKATARMAVDAAYARLDDVNRLMSDYVDDSEVGRLNHLSAGESLIVSPETFAVLEHAARISSRCGGALDVTCRPLMRLWREAAKAGHLPADDALATARRRVDWEKVMLDPATRSVSFGAEGMEIDLGAIAKGYALDLAVEAMKSAGATAGIVDVGGDVRMFGKRPDGDAWRIGVRHPFSDGLYGALHLRRGAVATSGLQQRYFEVDGRRYSHIVDPRSGWPVEQAPSVTVIAPTGVAADAWATVFSVLAVEEGRALAEDIEGIEGLWIWGSADRIETAQTDGFDAHLDGT